MTVEALFAGDDWTPQQCLVEALNVADDMECVVVAYLIKDSNGETRLRMSNTNSRDLLWLGNAIKCFAMED
jgi:hypothetical protein